MNPKLLVFPAVVLLTTACGVSELEIPMAERNDSGQSGTATLKENPGGLELTVNVAKGNASGPEIGHIHKGDCTQPGAPIAALTNLVDGVSVTRDIKDEDGNPLTLEKVLAEPHSVNFHSATDQSVYVSCGDIEQ